MALEYTTNNTAVNMIGNATVLTQPPSTFYLTATAGAYASAFSTYGTSWSSDVAAIRVQMGT